MQNKPSQAVIDKIMDYAITISKSECQACRDFRIMTSPTRENTLILRWTTIDIENIDHPVQKYRYECFQMDGTPQDCSIHYSNQKEANEFFNSLENLFQQEYSIDHKLHV